MDDIWRELYAAAMAVLKPRRLSSFVEVGGVAAAVEAASGKIYVGICVDAACTLGVCAERNAIFNMLTNGDSKPLRVVAVNWDGKVLPPCGACRELMVQLSPQDYQSIEIMLDHENEKVVTLGGLAPEWWI